MYIYSHDVCISDNSKINQTVKSVTAPFEISHHFSGLPKAIYQYSRNLTGTMLQDKICHILSWVQSQTFMENVFLGHLCIVPFLKEVEPRRKMETFKSLNRDRARKKRVPTFDKVLPIVDRQTLKKDIQCIEVLVGF